MKKRVCPLLERESSTRILSYAPPPWVLRECTETGFVFLENPPDIDDFKEEYAWEVTSKKESKAREEAEPILHKISNVAKRMRGDVFRRNKIIAIIKPLLDSSTSDNINILDIGCGWGGLIDGIISLKSQKRCVPFGIEISNYLAQTANEKFAQYGGLVIHDSALAGFATFDSCYFDVIVMSSFLEHEIHPLPVLRNCFRCCRDGGYIVIKVPNYGCLNRIIRGTRWCGFRWPDHVNYFTPDTLTEMAHRAGFHVARMKFVDRHPLSDNMYAVLRKPLNGM